TTDIVFTSSGKVVGYARGVNLVKGKGGLNVVVGKAGVQGVKFPSGKVTVGRIKSFAGAEKSKAFPTKVSQIQKIKISPKRILTVKRKVKAIAQLGRGRSAVVKGDKFIKTGVKFPSAKLVQKKA